MQETDLVEGIVARPEVDGPRHVYADWLDEQGRFARAAFVRLQVARQRLTEWDERRVALAVQEDVLAEARRGWESELPRSDGMRLVGWERGFPAEARFSRFDDLIRGHSLLGSIGVGRVRVPWPRDPDQVARLEPMRSVRGVTLIGRPPSTRGAGALLDLLADEAIDSLCLEGAGPLEPRLQQGLRDLLRRTELRALGLQGVRLDPDELVIVLEEVPRSLTTLQFGVALPRASSSGSVWEDDPRPFECVAGWPGLARIERLDLFGVRPGEQGLAAILDSPHAVSITALGLNLAARAVTFPVGLQSVLRPRVLNIESSELSMRLGEDLAGARSLSELKVLRLRHVRMSSRRVFERMFGGAFRHSLAVVDDAGTPPGQGHAEGVLEGVARGGCTALHSLTFDTSSVVTPFGGPDSLDRELEGVLASEAADTLRALVLGRPARNDELVVGPELVRRTLACPRLERLRVPTRLPARVAESIARMPAARRLLASGGMPDAMVAPG